MPVPVETYPPPDHAVEQLCNPDRSPYADALAEAGLKGLAHGLAALAVLLEAREAGVLCGKGAAAIVQAMSTYGIPDEMLSDNGTQFTGRLLKPAFRSEVLFERICRENDIVQRFTKVASPTTTVEEMEKALALVREAVAEAGITVEPDHLIREIAIYGGPVHEFVDPLVAAALSKKKRS